MRASNQYQTNAWHREFTIETRDPSQSPPVSKERRERAILLRVE
jgi:hypothetical protein